MDGRCVACGQWASVSHSMEREGERDVCVCVWTKSCE